MLDDVFYNIVFDNDRFLQYLDDYENPVYDFQALLYNFLRNRVLNKFQGQDIAAIPDATLADNMSKYVEEELELFESIEDKLLDIIEENKKFQSLHEDDQSNILPLLFKYLFDIYLECYEDRHLDRMLKNECSNQIFDILKVIGETDLAFAAAFAEKDESISKLWGAQRIHLIIDNFSKKYPLTIVEKGDYRLMLGVLYSLDKILSPAILQDIQAALDEGDMADEEVVKYMDDLIIQACTNVYFLHLNERQVRDYVSQFMHNDPDNQVYLQNQKIKVAVMDALESEVLPLLQKNLPDDLIYSRLKMILKEILPALLQDSNNTINVNSKGALANTVASTAAERKVLTELNVNKSVVTEKKHPDEGLTTERKTVRFAAPPAVPASSLAPA
jgi:hypothetical protein